MAALTNTLGGGSVLRDLHLEDFAPHLQTRFRLFLDPGGQLELQLVEAIDRGSTQWQEQFRLLFTGPPDTLLPQAIYPLEHEALGKLNIFLVPVGQSRDGFIYEAVFNRLVQQES